MLELAPLLFDEYDVLATKDCASVFELIDSFQPDIIMLDILLGVNDGAKICQLIKQNSAYKNITVVLMTAGFPRDKDRYAGADGFVEKPFETVKCLSLLNALTNHNN